MNEYTTSFYERQSNETHISSEVIVPLLLDLVQPQSVVDVGCGTGSWLRTFLQHGVKEVRGFDGPWLDAAKLLVPQEIFTRADLEKPLRVDNRVDLAISFEVAEHLSPESAEGFVESLISMSDVVAFSAAIPFQGGHHHLNEQWPEYWANLFEKKGYVTIDCLRMRLWNERNVHYWYRQNMLIYVRREALPRYPKLAEYQHGSWGRCRSFIRCSTSPGRLISSTWASPTPHVCGFASFRDTVSKRIQSLFGQGQKSPGPLLPPRPAGAPLPSQTH